MAVKAVGDEFFKFHMETAYSIRPGYIGDHPPPPQATTPAVVHWLLSGRQWSGVASDWKLSSLPVSLKPGDLTRLRTFLANDSRQCPVVFVSRMFASGQFSVDPERLAKVLAGNAFVVVASGDPDANNEMEWAFPKPFRCWGGMVRIYLPRILFGDERDAKRHRFYRLEDIERNGRQRVEEQLVSGLVRQPLTLRRPAISSIDDVYDRLRHDRIVALTAQQTDGKWNEWLTEFQSAVDRNKELVEKADGLELVVAEKEETIAEKEDENARLRFELEQNRRRAEEAEDTANSLQKRIGVLSAIRALPKDLAEVVDAVEKIHGDKVVFGHRVRAHGWRVQRAKWQGKKRIEITRPSSPSVPASPLLLARCGAARHHPAGLSRREWGGTFAAPPRFRAGSW